MNEFKKNGNLSKDWIGRPVFIQGDYKFVYGRFLFHFFPSISIKMYKLSHGKFKHICTYFYRTFKDNYEDGTIIQALKNQVDYHVDFNKSKLAPQNIFNPIQ